MDILEKELFEASWSKCTGNEIDFVKGYKESIKFCISKRLEGWTIDDFKADLDDTLITYDSFFGPYKDGIVTGLKTNIFNMEVKTNEYSCTS